MNNKIINQNQQNREEQEKQILEIIKEDHNKSGGHGGRSIADFDHILKGSISDKNAFLEKMMSEKKIIILEDGDQRLIMLPK